MSNAKFNKFEVPTKLLDELYELTGGPKAYKGLIVAYATENGEPVVYSKFDSQVIEYALHKAIETYMMKIDQTAYEIEENEENG